MRISDGSSAVCSSDLPVVGAARRDAGAGPPRAQQVDEIETAQSVAQLAVERPRDRARYRCVARRGCAELEDRQRFGTAQVFAAVRLEERRVGKEGVRKGRSGWVL